MKNVYKTVLDEQNQAPDTRKKLFSAVEKHLEGRTLVTFFTRFGHLVSLNDADCATCFKASCRA